MRQPTQRGMMTLEKIKELEAMKAKNAALQAQVEMYKRQAGQKECSGGSSSRKVSL